jgi:alpha-1,3/alpha-1,6-mannosyltransferase
MVRGLLRAGFVHRVYNIPAQCIAVHVITNLPFLFRFFFTGGYDERVAENKEHYLELLDFAKENNISDHVTFIRSFSDQEKLTLFARSSCLIYTPTNEHFGIVPIEAMYMRRPVIAVNTGGPLETVLHEETGYMCEPNEQAFSDAMRNVIKESDIVQTFGKRGRQHVISNFSFDAFSENLDKIVCRLHFFNFDVYSVD